MKKNILYLLLAALSFSCSSDKQAKINGSFLGHKEQSVYLELISTSGRSIIDSTLTNTKGDFRFKVDLPTSTPTFYNVKIDNASIPLIISPREKVALRSLGSIDKNYSVSGSLSSELIKEFNTMMNSSIKQLDSLSNIYSSLEENHSQREVVMSEYSKIYFQFKRDHIKFIISNANDMSAVYALYQRLPSDEILFNGDSDIIYLRTVADSIELRYPTSPHLRALREDIAKHEKVQELTKLIDQAKEVNFPDLRITNMYGEIVALSDIAQDKVVLIDFWTATKRQAAVINAELKDTYAEFSSKGFEIYQVSLDTDKALWVSAVQDQKLPWISVCNFQGSNSSAISLYGIKSLPSNVLLDKQGNIVGRDLYDENLYKQLKSMLK